MKLTDIHTKFKTDKGTSHSYITYYESIFHDIKSRKLNVLEIGVLFGGSLKMWSTYFENSMIFGIDNFVQKTGEKYYNYMPVDFKIVQKDLSSHKNIFLFNFDCESVNSINEHLKNIKFDIIIDDASHDINQQLSNITNYSNYLENNGIYICEDIQSKEDGKILLDRANHTFPNKKCNVLEFNCKKRSDDRLLSII